MGMIQGLIQVMTMRKMMNREMAIQEMPKEAPIPKKPKLYPTA